MKQLVSILRHEKDCDDYPDSISLSRLQEYLDEGWVVVSACSMGSTSCAFVVLEKNEEENKQCEFSAWIIERIKTIVSRWKNGDLDLDTKNALGKIGDVADSFVSLNMDKVQDTKDNNRNIINILAGLLSSRNEITEETEMANLMEKVIILLD